MAETLFTIGENAVTVGQALAASAALALAVLILLAIILGRAARARRSEAAAEAMRSAQLEQRMTSLARIQAETVGRLHAMGETLSGRQAEGGGVATGGTTAAPHAT